MWPPFFVRGNHVGPPRFLNKLPVAPAEAGAYPVSQYQLTQFSLHYPDRQHRTLI
jgi:hypothetical protein